MLCNGPDAELSEELYEGGGQEVGVQAARVGEDPGSATKHPFGNDQSELANYAWFNGIGEFETHPVGQKLPNRWGLYDMQGNVWEWCQDWFDENYYKQSPADDPQGPMQGDERVLRGGCWHYHPGACRPAERGYHVPETRATASGSAWRQSRSRAQQVSDPEKPVAVERRPVGVVAEPTTGRTAGHTCRRHKRLPLT